MKVIPTIDRELYPAIALSAVGSSSKEYQYLFYLNIFLASRGMAQAFAEGGSSAIRKDVVFTESTWKDAAIVIT